LAGSRRARGLLRRTAVMVGRGEMDGQDGLRIIGRNWDDRQTESTGRLLDAGSHSRGTPAAPMAAAGRRNVRCGNGGAATRVSSFSLGGPEKMTTKLA